jgi:hypothetical protein
MGLILDSSVVIAAERRGDTVTALLKQIAAATGDQRAVLSAVGVTELAHGIYRAQTPEVRNRREAFIRELLRTRVAVPPRPLPPLRPPLRILLPLLPCPRYPMQNLQSGGLARIPPCIFGSLPAFRTLPLTLESLVTVRS